MDFFTSCKNTKSWEQHALSMHEHETAQKQGLDTAQPNHYIEVCNIPKTWERNTAQPVTWAQLQYGLCNHDCNKKTACGGTEALAAQSAMQT